MDFSRIFIVELPDFFANFVAGFFHFYGKKCPENPPGKPPTKSSNFYTTKIPDNFLRRGQAGNFPVIFPYFGGRGQGGEFRNFPTLLDVSFQEVSLSCKRKQGKAESQYLELLRIAQDKDDGKAVYKGQWRWRYDSVPVSL